MTDKCPRCGFEYDPNSTQSLASQQVAVCKFCAENSRRIMSKKRYLTVPTDEFPTWHD